MDLTKLFLIFLFTTLIFPTIFICLTIFDYNNKSIYYNIIMGLVILDTILIIIISNIFYMHANYDDENKEDHIV